MQNTVKLTATLNGKAVTSQNCNSMGITFVANGSDGKPVFTVTPWQQDRDFVTLTTKKNTAILRKHETQNYFCGTVAGIKVHVILKKMVGELIFWATDVPAAPKQPVFITTDSHGVQVSLANITPEGDVIAASFMIKLPEGYNDGTTKAPRATEQKRSYLIKNGSVIERIYWKKMSINGNMAWVHFNNKQDQLDLDIIKAGLIIGALNRSVHINKTQPISASAAQPMELETPQVTSSDPMVAFANLFPQA